MVRPGPGCDAAFYDDLPQEEAKAWKAELRPSTASVTTTGVKDPGWDLDVSFTYVLSEEDRALPAFVQEMMLKEVANENWKVVRLPGGHSPFLSQIEALGDVFKEVAGVCS